MTGAEITIHEKMLVPGDFVPYEILYETDVWQGEPVIKLPDPIPLQVEGAKQFGGDESKKTLDKITSALGTLLERKAAVTVPSTDIIKDEGRGWR